MNKRIRSGLLHLTTPFRRKPDYLIIGAQKSGTSTLFQLLSDNPNVENSHKKEIHYFDWNYDRSLSWYKLHFPITRVKVTGEATPFYLYHPDCPARVRQDLPDCKLILLLRNPVDRAYAHYHMSKRKKKESLSFENAIDTERSRMTKALEEAKLHNRYDTVPLLYHNYLSRGIYQEQLKRWFLQFPRSSFHILSFEDFITQPQLEYDRICTFLNILKADISILPRLNADTYEDMDKRTRSKLIEYFRPHNEQLFELIGYSLPWSEQ